MFKGGIKKTRTMKLTNEKVRIMRHALGIDAWKNPKKMGEKLIAFRNHYCVQNQSKEFTWWEELAKDKLAVRITGIVNGFVYYGVSELGISELEKEIREKIVLTE